MGNTLETARQLVDIAASLNILRDMRLYAPHADIIAFKFTLDVNNVQYRRLKNDNNAVLLNSYDISKAYELDKSLQSYKCYMQEFRMEKFINATKKFVGLKNKSLTFVAGIDKDICDKFLDECNKIREALPVGIAREIDGTFTVAFSDGMLSIKDKKEIINAYIKANILVRGEISMIGLSKSEYTAEDYQEILNENRIINSCLDMVSNNIDISEPFAQCFFKSVECAVSSLPEKNVAYEYVIESLTNTRVSGRNAEPTQIPEKEKAMQEPRKENKTR